MTAPNPNWYSIDIDQSHEIVALGQPLQLNGKSWRVVQIEDGPTHYGYRVAGTAGIDVHRLAWALADSGLMQRYADYANTMPTMRHGTAAELAVDWAPFVLRALSSEASVIPLRVVVWLEEA